MQQFADKIDAVESRSKRKALLEERARKIAYRKEKEAAESDKSEFLLFSIEHELYAIEACYISEVYPLIDPTIVPCVPKWIYGVINVRRKIYSIVDLQNFFQLPQQQERECDKVIILEDGATSFAILTHDIIGVQAISTEELQSPLPTISNHCKEYIKGITDDRIVLLDGYKLIHSEELVVNEE